jgi:flagellar hook-length control protein FliK
MSALHPLPSAAAVVASTKTAAAVTPADPAAGEVSFAAVLSAQLGLPSITPLSILGSSSDEPAPEDKALPDTLPADMAADAANALSIVPLALPVAVPAPVATVEDIAHAMSKSDKPALVGKTVSPSTETLRNTFLTEQPMPESPATGSAQTPANFAAALQALPAGEDRHEHADAIADTPSAPLPAATLAVASEPQPAHRGAPLATAVPVPVQDARWTNAFSEKVVWITGQQVQAAEIHIEPPQLGPIEVRVSITNDQANLLFNAPHAVARDAIQMSLPRLQEMLLESGLTLGNVSVGAHNAGGQQARDGADRGADRSSADTIASVDAVGTQTTLRLQHGAGLVDLFA